MNDLTLQNDYTHSQPFRQLQPLYAPDIIIILAYN